MAPRERYEKAEAFYDCEEDYGRSGHGRAKRSKSVRFSEWSSVHLVDPLKLLTKEEKARVWYSKKEQSRFRESAQRVVSFLSRRSQMPFNFGMSFAEEPNSQTFCSRGLERHTTDGTAVYMERRRSLQAEMYVMRVTDATPERIAAVTSAHSSQCVHEAFQRAREDALDAMKHQKEDIRKVMALIPDQVFQNMKSRSSAAARQRRRQRELVPRESKNRRVAHDMPGSRGVEAMG